MIEIKRNEPCKFDFEMEIAGGDGKQSKPEVFFDLQLSEFTLRVNAVHKENAIYSVNLPALNMITECGSYNCAIGVKLDDHYFTPFTEVCKITEDPKPKITEFKNQTQATPTFNIKVTRGVQPEKIVETKGTDVTGSNDAAPRAPKVPEAKVGEKAPEKPKIPPEKPKVPPEDQNLFNTLLKKK